MISKIERKIIKLKKLLRCISNKIKASIWNLYWAIRYRTTDRYHIVNTKLPPNYYDKNQIMLHANFSILEEYVVEELGSLGLYFCPFILPKWKRKLPEPLRKLFITHREREEAAIDYIHSSYDKNDQKYNDCMTMIESLYYWWTRERPKRKDPYEELYEYTKHLNLKYKSKTIFLDTNIGSIKHLSFVGDGGEEEKYDELLDECVKMEEAHLQEDTNKLIDLMKIREFLWT